MLDFLFNSEISFPKSWERESQLGNLVEAVQDLSAKIETLLGVEHLEFWQQYQDQAQQLQNLNCQIEFDRGFLIGAELLVEVMTRTRGRV